MRCIFSGDFCDMFSDICVHMRDSSIEYMPAGIPVPVRVYVCMYVCVRKHVCIYIYVCMYRIPMNVFMMYVFYSI